MVNVWSENDRAMPPNHGESTGGRVGGRGPEEKEGKEWLRVRSTEARQSHSQSDVLRKDEDRQKRRHLHEKWN